MPITLVRTKITCDRCKHLTFRKEGSKDLVCLCNDKPFIKSDSQMIESDVKNDKNTKDVSDKIEE